MNNAKKHSIQLLLAVAMVLFGIALIVVAFAYPPAGHIDPTVLTAYGETLTFSGALMGLDYRYRNNRDNSPPADE